MRPGEHAPDFTLPADDGAEINLTKHLEGGPVVLFFYPKAMTPGCTAESCHFRDLASEFAAVGAQRVGISADDTDRQRRFSEKHGFDFPLLSDTDRKVASAYGVKRLGPLMNKRVTFVIDTDRTLLDVIASEMNMDRHADEALAVLRKRANAPKPEDA
jgi:thioredoxin-dependent peroxiredoxin